MAGGQERILRERSQLDKRVVVFSLSQHGHKTVEQAMKAVWNAAEQQ